MTASVSPAPATSAKRHLARLRHCLRRIGALEREQPRWEGSRPNEVPPAGLGDDRVDDHRGNERIGLAIARTLMILRALAPSAQWQRVYRTGIRSSLPASDGRLGDHGCDGEHLGAAPIHADDAVAGTLIDAVTAPGAPLRSFG